MKLTAAALDTLPEGEHTDHVVLGLTFDVGKKRRRWFLRYRIAGKQMKPTLGYYVPRAPEGSDSMGLAAARAAAREMLGRVEAGVPVAEEKPAHPKEGGKTLATVIDDYEKMKRAKGKGVKSLDEALRTVRRGLTDYLDLPAKQFSKADLRKARDKMAKGVRKRKGKVGAPQLADRFLSYLSPILTWAAKEDFIEMNLVAVTHKTGPGLVRRKRVLSPDEMRAIWDACPKMESAEGKAYGRLVRYLMVVPCRISEAAAIKHGTIIDGRWRQTEEENKSAREHLLRLPQLALDQLGTGTAGEWAFPGRRPNGKAGGKLSGFSRFKTELDGLCGVSEWVHHDLRRSITTTLQDMVDADDMPLFSRDVISALMNHAIDGADGHYLHGTMAKAKAKALEVWAAKLDGILKTKSKRA